ncbi:MAG: DciA family protein [Kiloniellales bacterium]|nr:DciA family protein [Kiloniellales bacterium]
MPLPRPRDGRNARSPGKPARGGGPKALADSLRKVTRQALGQRSLAEQSLILDWPSIAGGDIAGMCTPQGLSFQRRDRRTDGTLALKVQPGQATRLQHLEPQLIERINGYLGYRAIARLRLLHGSIPAAGAPEPGREARTKDPAPRETGVVEGIADPALRAALARLGRAVKTPQDKRQDKGHEPGEGA